MDGGCPIFKNTATQQWIVFAFEDEGGTNPGEPVTGNAANITANVRIDAGAANAVDDTNPTELEDGYYSFGITAAESNGDSIVITPVSATANVNVIGVPGAVYTRAAFGPTVSEFNARTLVAASYFDPAADAVATVTDVTNQVTADMTAISGDTTAAANLESTYDGTGYTDDAAPATQSQIGNLATGSAAISVQAASYTLTSGTQSSGTVSDTETLNNVYHEHTDTAGVLDLYYQFDVTGAGVATSADFNVALQGINDSLGVYAYDWGNTAWDQIGSIQGTATQVHNDDTVSLLTRHTGTGANLGLVRLRFYAASGLTTATLSIDQVYCSYAVVSQTVGYALGSIWGDTTHGVAGTEIYVNGVADNPALTLAEMVTLSSSLGMHRFQMSPESTITFAESHTDEVWAGDGWTLAFGGQDISQSHFYHCNDISGIGTTPSGEAHILDSHIAATTLGACHITNCTFMSTFAGGAAANYFIENSRSGVAGSGSPTLTFSGNGASSNINARNWFGGGTWVFDADCTASIEVALGGTHTITTGGGDIEFRGNPKALTVTTSLTGTTNIIVGNGAPITINGTGGTVNVYGAHNGITDNSSGTTVTDFGQDITEIGDVLVDTGTTIPSTLGTPTDTDLATDIANVQTATNAIPTTAMRGTDSAALASVCTEGRLAELDAGNLPTDIAAIPTTAMRGTDNAATATALATVDSNVDAILVDTNATIPGLIAALNNAPAVSVADILTTQMTESYAADGAAPTLAQSLMLIQQSLGDFAISGTTLTVKKVDGATTAATFTLDSATVPTSTTRAS